MRRCISTRIREETAPRDAGEIRRMYKELADGYAGPAVVETFGEVPFEPVNKNRHCT